MKRRDDPLRAEMLEQARREVNASRREVKDWPQPQRSKGDFGPWWGFASLGDIYGQNRPGFFPAPQIGEEKR